MMELLTISITILVCSSSLSTILCDNINKSLSKNIICYWQGILPANQIDPQLCSHIIYSFLGVDNFGNLSFLYSEQNQGESRLMALELLTKQNKNLKILAAVGGADTQQTQAFSAFSKSIMARSKFIGNLINFCKKFSLHGIDIDYEYPQTNDDKLNFAQLLEETRQAFDVYGFILSIAVAPDKWRAEKAYEITRISESVHIINLMTYDFHGPWSGNIAHHAQMFPHNRDSNYSKELNCASSVAYWITMGAQPSKLHLGIPTYGNVFFLTNSKAHKIGENSINRIATLSSGFPMGYDEYCKLKKFNWTQQFDSNYRVYYATNKIDLKWFGFDHPNQVVMKTKFIDEWNLGGAMIWSIDIDDYENNCGFGKFPLLSSANETLQIG